MKIAVASSGLGHVARGIEAWAADLGAELYRRGHDVTLYKGGGREEQPYERVVRCCRRSSNASQRLLRLLPRRISWRFGLGSGYSLEQLTFSCNLLKELRRKRADVLHVQDPSVAKFMTRARSMGLLGTKTILAHGTEETDAFLQSLPFVQHLAPWHLEDCARRNCGKAEWAAIPNFIDTSRFSNGSSFALRRELGIADDALVVMTAAAIKREHKRIHILLDEVARLPSHIRGREVVLVVAGGREAETDQLVAEANSRFGNRVRLLIAFPRERMRELYRSADLFALASLKEMMPVALLEATASGLPCVVHRHPIMQWMIGPGGLAVDLEQPGTLAGACLKLLADDDLRAEFGAAARNHCVANFDAEPVVSQIVQYYRQVLELPNVDALPHSATLSKADANLDSHDPGCFSNGTNHKRHR